MDYLDEIKELEKYAKDDYDAYTKICSFFKESDFNTLNFRLKCFDRFRNVPFLTRKLTDFETYADFERYVFENKIWAAIFENIPYNSNDQYNAAKAERKKIDPLLLKKVARHMYPKVCQPYLDKAISFFKNDTLSFTDVFGSFERWIANSDIFNRLGIKFEKYECFGQLHHDTARTLLVYDYAMRLYKEMPVEFRKNYDTSKLETVEQLDKLHDEIREHCGTDGIKNFTSSLTSKQSTIEKVYHTLYIFRRAYNLKERRIAARFVPSSHIVYHDDLTLVIAIKSFVASKVLGTDKWCLSRTLSHWNSYTRDDKNSFYIVYNLRSKHSMVGVCISNSSNVVLHANNQVNSCCSAEYTEKYPKLMSALARYNQLGWIDKFRVRFKNRFYGKNVLNF